MFATATKGIFVEYPRIIKQYMVVFLFFIIWPFGTFIYAFLNLDKSWSRSVLILFTAIFGYTMIPESRTLDLYNIMHSLPDYSLLSFRNLLYSNPFSDSPDIYRDVISFIVAHFTVEGRWLMLVFGIFTGLAYTRVVDLFAEDNADRSLYFYLLLVVFSFIVGIDQLGGVRFVLAAYVFFFGAVRVIYGEKRYLLVAALSVMIHFSFWSTFLLLLGFLFIKRLPVVIYSILILSFILPDFLQEYIIQFSGLFGQSIETRAETYSNLVSELDYDSQRVWFVRHRIPIMIYFSYFMLAIIRIWKRNLKFTVKLDHLFLFSLLMLSFINFTNNIPHLGYRFQFIYLMYAFFFLLIIYINNRESTLIKGIVILSFIASFLMLSVTVRSVLYYSPLSLFISSLPGIFSHQPEHSVWVSFFQ